MVWIAASSRAGYDYPGTYDKKYRVQVQVVSGVLGETGMPGALSCPFVLADRQRIVRTQIEVS